MASAPPFLAPLLALALPATLFVGCLWSMLVTVRRHRHGQLGVAVYFWLAVDVLVMVLATSWLAKSLQVLGSAGLSEEQARATLSAGPALFLALGLFLVARPLIRGARLLWGRAASKAGTFRARRTRSGTDASR